MKNEFNCLHNDSSDRSKHIYWVSTTLAKWKIISGVPDSNYRFRDIMVKLPIDLVKAKGHEENAKIYF